MTGPTCIENPRDSVRMRSNVQRVREAAMHDKDQLRIAEQHVADGEERIAKQARLIVRLYWCGYRNSLPSAIELLHVLEESQQAALLHLKIIREENVSWGPVDVG